MSKKDIEFINENKTKVVNNCLVGNKEKQEVCNKVNNDFCIAYMNPEFKWRYGFCNAASNITLIKEKKKIRVGQQKQKKR